MTTRRKFIKATSLMAGGISASFMPYSIQSVGLAHHVFFWLKNSESAEDRNKLIQGIKSLSNISTVRSLHIGVPAATSKREVIDDSYDVSELIFFDDIAGQNAYQVDPIHLKFVEEYSHLWSKVLVYDTMSVE
ncbi:MAG: Dabb family protein [Cyclobacteriaceae bacterium]|nr:Dabb family protein [Cyclobacteriaceae bacterium]